MNKLVVIILLGFLALVFGGALVAVGTYISYANSGNQFENNILARQQDNQNILGQYTIRISEMAQVPEVYRDDLKEVIAATFEGRYGEDGASGVFNWIQEQNLQFDSTLYNRLQQSMEAGRIEFRNAQTSLIDTCRSYKTALGNVWSGFWLNLAGYPGKQEDFDLKETCRPIVAGNTQQIFDSGVDTGVQLRRKSGVE